MAWYDVFLQGIGPAIDFHRVYAPVVRQGYQRLLEQYPELMQRAWSEIQDRSARAAELIANLRARGLAELAEGLSGAGRGIGEGLARRAELASRERMAAAELASQERIAAADRAARLAAQASRLEEKEPKRLSEELDRLGKQALAGDKDARARLRDIAQDPDVNWLIGPLSERERAQPDSSIVGAMLEPIARAIGEERAKAVQKGRKPDLGSMEMAFRETFEPIWNQLSKPTKADLETFAAINFGVAREKFDDWLRHGPKPPKNPSLWEEIVAVFRGRPAPVPAREPPPAFVEEIANAFRDRAVTGPSLVGYRANNWEDFDPRNFDWRLLDEWQLSRPRRGTWR